MIDPAGHYTLDHIYEPARAPLAPFDGPAAGGGGGGSGGRLGLIDLAEYSVIARYHATLNPASIMGKRGEITVDDVMNSRPIDLFRQRQ